MARHPNDSPAVASHQTALLVLVFATCSLLYTGIALARRRASMMPSAAKWEEVSECCKGLEETELWGSAVKWGKDFATSRECCEACKALCSADGPCLCDTWVYCGDRDRCADKFGQCWLKKQRDVLAPDVHESGEHVMWTSGIIFGKGEGIVGLETEYGTLHMKLFPDCAPQSIAYILELLKFRHSVGCQFYRAEGRGLLWNTEGNRMDDASFGPPYALLQGTFGADGIRFNAIPNEFCSKISRGSVAWVGSGPDFFISLANHHEWTAPYTVFASLYLPEDMVLAEKLSSLPTNPSVWNGVNVSLLEKPISLKVKRITGN